MSHCFLCGSRRDGKEGTHPLKIIHYIEYLTYDFECECVTIVADFIIKNLTDSPHRLVLLHRGNIVFENCTDGWLEDKQWTPVILGLACDEVSLISDQMGLVLNEENQLLLCQVDGDPIRVRLLTGGLRPWGEACPENDHYIPFTSWDSPEIPAQALALIRVKGCLRHDSYEHLLPSPGSGDAIIINGGQSLCDEINEELKSYGGKDYSRPFREFTSLYWDNPIHYHVFFERRGQDSLKTLSVSSDMTKVLVNQPIPRDRHINWFWSYSDFNIHTLANGPVVKLQTV
jgi:hypothetical protein